MKIAAVACGSFAMTDSDGRFMKKPLKHSGIMIKKVKRQKKYRILNKEFRISKGTVI
jgi:hypothetical protein